MTRISLLIALCTTVLACEGKRETVTSPVGAAGRPTYTIAGTVHDSEGVGSNRSVQRFRHCRPCDPGGWDESAPCRRFYFIAPATGRLSIDNAWNGVPPLDATIVIPANRYVATSTDKASTASACPPVSLRACGTRYE
jgi:hypothetical protein